MRPWPSPPKAGHFADQRHDRPGEFDGLFSNNWIAFAPAAFSFAPAIVRVLPNAGRRQAETRWRFSVTVSAAVPAAQMSQSAVWKRLCKGWTHFPHLPAHWGWGATYPFALESIALAVHPTGALLYVRHSWTAPRPRRLRSRQFMGHRNSGCAHNGRLWLRVYLPEPFAMPNTDIDGLHGGFLTTDENSQRLYAITTSGLSVIQLANVPVGIGKLSPACGPASGGTSITLPGSGFQSGTSVTIGGKSVSVAFKDMNTLTVTTPALTPGALQMVVSNADGETASLDAAFLAQ